MKKRILALTMFIGFSLYAAEKSEKREKKTVTTQDQKTVTFINEDEASKIQLTIFNAQDGAEQTKKTISSKGQFVFTIPNDMDIAIQAKEVSGDNLETGTYHVWIRTQDTKGTIRINRHKAIFGGEELSFVGNKEEDQEGAFVRKPLIPYSWE